MEITGERFMPEVDADWTLEHTHRYFLAREAAQGKVVLDIACGEGYGSRLLADVAAKVVGVDISLEAVHHAAKKYTHPRLVFVQGSATAIPLADDSVDLVISFETIEHLAEHEAMLAEIRRVLRPGGMLCISSPDKYEYSDVPGYANEYHVKELYRDEFEDLLKRYFSHIQIQGQRVVFSSVMGSEHDSAFVSWDKSGPESRAVGLSEAEYIIALAGDQPASPLPSSVLKTQVEQSNRVRELKLRMSDDLEAFRTHNRSSNERIEVLERQVESFKKQVAFLEEQNRSLQETMKKSLDEIYASRSWRVTAPLRDAGRLVRRLLHVARRKNSGNVYAPPMAVEPVATEAVAIEPVWPPHVLVLEKQLPLDPDAAPGNARLGVFLHIFYVELLDEMLECLRYIPVTAYIHISTDTEVKRRVIAIRCEKRGFGERADIRVCPNMGWDIAPFLVGFADKIPDYDLVLRLHSKSSTHIARHVGDAWRRMLFTSLTGTPERVNGIMKLFADNPDLGMLCPPSVPCDKKWIHYGGNLLQMRQLLRKYDIEVREEVPIDFPMGSMFWCRPQVLAPWLELGFSYDDFLPTAENERDGTLAHALERLFFFGCGIAGYSWTRVEELFPRPQGMLHL